MHGSTFECRVPAETCSLLYLNPPYDSEVGGYNNQRMELVFLDHCYRWVMTAGLLVFVIPVSVLAACARLLASQFEQIRVFRLQHPHCVRFNQIAVLGKRKKTHTRSDPDGAAGLIRASLHSDLIPPLTEQVAERYVLPPSPPATITYTGLPLDELEDALQRSMATQNAMALLVRKPRKLTGRPVLPLHRGAVVTIRNLVNCW